MISEKQNEKTALVLFSNSDSKGQDPRMDSLTSAQRLIGLNSSQPIQNINADYKQSEQLSGVKYQPQPEQLSGVQYQLQSCSGIDDLRIERELLGSSGYIQGQPKQPDFFNAGATSNSNRVIRIDEVYQDEIPLKRVKQSTNIIQNSNALVKTSAATNSNLNPHMNLKEKLQILASSQMISKRVSYFLSNFTASGRRHFLEKIKVRWTIDDKSDYMSADKKVFFLLRILAQIKQNIYRASPLNNSIKLRLINPHNWISIALLAFFTFFNSCFFLIFSISLIYIGPAEYDLIAHKATSVIWMIEVFFQLNTKIFQGSNIVSDRYLIALNYLKTRAVYDFVAILLLEVMPEQTQERVICQIFIFIKVKNLFKDIEQVQKHLYMSIKNFPLIELMNLCIEILVFGHIVACAYYLIGQFELNILEYETTWYDEGLGKDYTWWKLYLESIYWSLTLLTTGSNVAFSLMQMLFTTTAMLGTTIMFGYMLNVTGSIISQFDAKDQNKRLDLNIINEYMRQNKISKELQTRVNMDIENYYSSNVDQFKADKQQILQKISPNLQRLLRLEYCHSILNHMPIIKEKFSPELQEELCDIIEEVYYLPNQIIFSEQQYEKISLMLIIQGSVELTQSIAGDPKKLKSICQFNEKELFSKINFFTGSAHDRQAKSCQFTKIVKIDREKFQLLAQKRERDHQVFIELKDTLFIYEDFESVNEKCIFCQSSTHIDQECNLVHLQKYEIIQKLRFFENLFQARSTFNRSRLRNQRNPIILQNTIAEFQKIYNEDIESEIPYEDDYGEIDNPLDSVFQPTDIEAPQINKDGQNTLDLTEKGLKELLPFSTIHEENLTGILVKESQFPLFEPKDSHSKYLAIDQVVSQPKLKEKLDQSLLLNQNRPDIIFLDQNRGDLDANILITSEQSPLHRLASKREKEHLIEQQPPKRRESKIKQFPVSENPQQDSIKRIQTNRLNSSTKLQAQQLQQQQMASPQLISQHHRENQRNSFLKLSIATPFPNIVQLIPQNQVKSDKEETSEHSSILQEVIDWDFDRQRDYKYYFPKGNVKNILSKRIRMQRKRAKDQVALLKKKMQPKLIQILNSTSHFK